MDWFIDENSDEWFVGEEMEVRVFDPIDGWQFYGVYDTTDETDSSILVFLAKLELLGFVDIRVEFYEFLY